MKPAHPRSFHPRHSLSLFSAIAAASLALLMLEPGKASAQTSVPLFMNYQGTVTDSTGTALGSGTAVNRKVIFRLYDASTGGNKQWTEEQTVTIYNGQFSVLLGNGVDASGTAAGESRRALDTVFTGTGNDRYLGVTVDNGDNTIDASDTEIAPRQRITSTAYAMRAKTADSVATGSDLLLNGSSNYGLGWYGTDRVFNGTAVNGPVLYGAAGGALGSVNGTSQSMALTWNGSSQVGIGTNSLTNIGATTKLILQGDDTNAPPTQLSIQGNANTNKRLLLGYNTTGNYGSIQAYSNFTTTTKLALNPVGGNVGIGTTSPTAALEVNGDVKASSATISGTDSVGSLVSSSTVTAGSTSGFIFAVNKSKGMFSTGDDLFFKTNNAEVIRVLSTGKVGIGTTAPTSPLAVVGTIRVDFGATSTGTSLNSLAFGTDNNVFISAPKAGTTNLNGLNFATGGSSKMSIDSAGNVGIRTVAPLSQLSITTGTSTTPTTKNITAKAITSEQDLPNNSTLTLTASGHGFAVGDEVVITGVDSDTATDPIFNGTYRINAVPTNNTFTIQHLREGGGNLTTTAVSGGKVTKVGNAAGSLFNSLGELTFMGNTSTQAAASIQALAGTTDSMGSLLFKTTPAGGTALKERMRVDHDGTVYIGGVADALNSSSGPRGKLVVNGGGPKQYFDYRYLTSTGVNAVNDSGEAFSIWATNRIASNEFNAFSDERIKNIQGVSSGAKDLTKLMGIQITDYTFRDPVKNGRGQQKKVIAQQVEKVYPLAVHQSTEVVPDIMQTAVVKDGWIVLKSDVKKGDRVRLLTEGDKDMIVEVNEVAEGKFKISTQLRDEDRSVFIYGREVNDFRSVDYDAIAMLNVSATQQVKKDSDAAEKALRAENAALRAQLEAQEKRLAALEAQELGRAAKLVKLEALLERMHTQESVQTASLTISKP